jgi:hypothetical protein
MRTGCGVPARRLNRGGASSGTCRRLATEIQVTTSVSAGAGFRLPLAPGSLYLVMCLPLLQHPTVPSFFHSLFPLQALSPSKPLSCPCSIALSVPRLSVPASVYPSLRVSAPPHLKPQPTSLYLSVALSFHFVWSSILPFLSPYPLTHLLFAHLSPISHIYPHQSRPEIPTSTPQ